MAVADPAFGNQKVDLHTTGGVAAGCVVVEIEFVTACSEHLGDDVFHDKAFVDFDFIKKQFFVDLLADDSIFIKKVADQQTGIGHITF